MKASEENIDNKIKNILSDGALETVGTRFTSNVMLKVNAIALQKARIKHIRKQVLLGILGFVALGTISTTLFLLWQQGVITPIINHLIGFVKPLISTLPFGISPWFLIAGLVHLLLFRGIMAFYVVNKHRKVHIRSL